MKLQRTLATLTLTGLTLLLTACNNSDRPIRKSEVQFPTTSYANRNADTTTTKDKISMDDTGYLVDMNGDGVQDYVTVEGDTFVMATMNSDGSISNPRVILQVEGRTVAYNVIHANNDTKPDIVFYNKELQGFYQLNQGTDENGLPQFGDVEKR